MASDKTKTFDDLDLSKDEVKRLGEALKDEKFRKMLIEYAEEISDPENRRKAEEEIRMMESERGMNVQFVHPKPGHVLKTTVDGSTKAFINISQNDKIEKPSSKKQAGTNGTSGLMWHIPHSFAPPRDDTDKAKSKCKVYDVVFHPDTYRMATNNNRFLKLVEDTALEGIERQFGVKLDRNNIKRPKMTFKGQPVATVIRERKSDEQTNVTNDKPDSDSILDKMPYPYDNKTTAEKSVLHEKNMDQNNKTKVNGKLQSTESESDKFTTPKYTVTHRSNVDMSEYRNAPDAKTSTRPNELVIKIELPLLKSANQLNLDIFNNKITLESTVPAAYKLDLNLPFPVNDDEGSAKFDKSKRTLTVTLPVIKEKTPEIPFSHNHNGGGDNLGLESDDKTIDETSSGLITVIPDSSSSSENHENGAAEEINSVHNSCIDNLKSNSNHSEKKKQKLPKDVKWILPEYQLSQDSETVSLVLKVNCVQEQSVSTQFKEKTGLRVEFMSVGEGGFPSYYAVCLDFGEGCCISDRHCTVDVSDDNVVLLVLKDKDCRKLWNSFLVGLDEKSMEINQFLTESNLKRELRSLDEEAGCEEGGMESNGGEQQYDLSVLEMMADRLTIEIKSNEKEEEGDLEGIEMDPSSPCIEVVHRHPTPPLHSILKQRTISESSEDHSWAASSNSIVSVDDDLSSSHGSCSLKRRTVSFNSKVDQTSFKSNASVSSMVPTLKNKRKKQRKREEKLKKTEKRRMRKLSGSAGEGTSSGEDVNVRESFSDSHSVSEEEEGGLEREAVFQRSISDPGPNVEHDEDDDEEEEEEVYEKIEKKQSVGFKCSDDMVEVSCPEVDGNGLSKESERGVDSRTTINPSGDECDSESGSKGDGESGEQASNNWSEKVTKEIQSKLAANNKNSVVEKEDSDDDDECNDNCDNDNKVSKSEETVKTKGKLSEIIKEKSNVETMLSWKDGPSSNSSEHATKCAFQFANTLMYDLDVE